MRRLFIRSPKIRIDIEKQRETQQNVKIGIYFGDL